MFSIDTALVRNPQHVDSSAGNTCMSTYCKNINNWKIIKLNKEYKQWFYPRGRHPELFQWLCAVLVGRDWSSEHDRVRGSRLAEDEHRRAYCARCCFCSFYPGTGLSFRIFISSSAFLRASSLPAPVLISSISFPLFVLQCSVSLCPLSSTVWEMAERSIPSFYFHLFLHISRSDYQSYRAD